MTDALGRFLRAQAAIRFQYGAADCTLLPADWIVLLGHADPAGPWRGVYGDEAGADAILTAHGGAVALATARFDPLALARPSHAVRGDVGVVSVQGKAGPVEVGAICTGTRWATRARKGLWIGPAEPLAIWRP